MVGLGNFDPRTGTKWYNNHKTATAKVKKGVVQAAAEEDRESNEEDKETGLPSYAQLIKANGFINISVHGDANREEFGSIDGDAVSEFGIRCLHSDDASLPGTTRHNQGATFADAGQRIVQGGGGTKTDKNKHSRVKNNNATEKTREAVPDTTSAGAQNTVPPDMGGQKPILAELHIDRFTLDNWK